MKKIILSLILSSLPLFAETLPAVLYIDGTKYMEVVYQKRDAANVQFMHSDGVASVPIAKLPEDIQKQFNYDPQAAEVEAQRQHAAKEDAERRISEKKKAVTERMKSEGSVRDDSVRQTEIRKLKATIKSCSEELDRVAKDFNSSVDYLTSKSATTDIFGESHVSAKASYRAENTVENKSKKDRVEALQKTIDNCKDRLKELQ